MSAPVAAMEQLADPGMLANMGKWFKGLPGQVGGAVQEGAKSMSDGLTGMASDNVGYGAMGGGTGALGLGGLGAYAASGEDQPDIEDLMAMLEDPSTPPEQKKQIVALIQAMRAQEAENPLGA
jgi:hypothetical protein